MTENALGWVTPRMIEFYALLDTNGIPPMSPKPKETDGDRWSLAIEPQRLEALSQTLQTQLSQLAESSLVDHLSTQLRDNPEYFLVLAHVFRQKKFTNAELAHFFFDANQTSNLDYFRSVEQRDPAFSKATNKAKSTDWVRVSIDRADPFGELAGFKKAVDSYLDNEKRCWGKWRSRILYDESVARRISEYVVRHEHLYGAVSGGALTHLLRYSLRATSSEDTKINVGKMGANRVEAAFKEGGMSRLDCGHQRHAAYAEVQRCASTHKGGAWYEREVDSGKPNRVYDFVIGGSGLPRHAVETNYYTSGGSKIDKTVKDFGALELELRSTLPLIYVTDGPGWLGLVSLVRQITKIDSTRGRANVPFLFNLRQLRSYLPELIRRLNSGV